MLHRILFLFGFCVLAGCSKPSPEVSSAREMVFHVPGMHCSSCVGTIRGALRGVEGVGASRFDLEARTVTIEILSPGLTREQVKQTIGNAGFPVDDAPAATP